ncbi:MAG: HTH domain-containing protein, partial [Lachnospiraceae bacterium]|nr:HTH domain-containing protein [Lachnospiraceae bacterium]
MKKRINLFCVIRNKGAVIDGLFRRDIYELPTTAIREIIVNAVLHRSYADPASIQVSIFDNRIEIDSPGMLYAGLTVAEAMSGKSKCRNKAIAEAFQYMKLIEGWGTGLPRLFKRCKEMGLPEPKFEEFGDGIKVTIYRGNRAVLKDSEINMDSYVGESVGEGVGDVGENVGNVGEKSKIDIDIKKIILQLIRDDNKISAADIAKTISVARRTVERHIKDLREEGVL